MLFSSSEPVQDKEIQFLQNFHQTSQNTFEFLLPFSILFLAAACPKCEDVKVEQDPNEVMYVHTEEIEKTKNKR